MSAEFKVGDWVILDMDIGQIKEIRCGVSVFSTGHIETSGSSLMERFRPLTLRNKAIAEGFNCRYEQLRSIDGERGFNYPDISEYFSQLALLAIDYTEDELEFHHRAIEFIRRARHYQPIIDGIRLFRRAA